MAGNDSRLIRSGSASHPARVYSSLDRWAVNYLINNNKKKILLLLVTEAGFERKVFTFQRFQSRLAARASTLFSVNLVPFFTTSLILAFDYRIRNKPHSDTLWSLYPFLVIVTQLFTSKHDQDDSISKCFQSLLFLGILAVGFGCDNAYKHYISSFITFRFMAVYINPFKLYTFVRIPFILKSSKLLECCLY